MKEVVASVKVELLHLTTPKGDHILHEQGYNTAHCIPVIARHNGKVERSHREEQKRFYASRRFFSLSDFANRLAVYNARSNNGPMKPLNRLSPEELLAQGTVRYG